MTNGDKIRALPDEFLARIINRCCISASCQNCPMKHICGGIFRTRDDWFDWLESEAEE